jgi:hypothetical protein
MATDQQNETPLPKDCRDRADDDDSKLGMWGGCRNADLPDVNQKQIKVDGIHF